MNEKSIKDRISSEMMEGMLLAIIASTLYFLAYRINEFTDTWSIYTQGINLVFLPAGIKHIAILLARGWGALGCFVALFFLASESWTGEPTVKVLGYCVVSILTTWLGIIIGFRLMHIDNDLSNLEFIHLPFMDLITTALHGHLVNAYFILVGMKADHLIQNAFAMMVGDFIGSFIILMCMLLALKFFRLRKI